MVRLIRCTECNENQKGCDPCAACPDANPRHCAQCHTARLVSGCDILPRNKKTPVMPLQSAKKQKRAIKTAPAPASAAPPSAVPYHISDYESSSMSSDSSSTSESEDASASVSVFADAPTLSIAVDHFDMAIELAREIPSDITIPFLPSSAFSLDVMPDLDTPPPDFAAPIEGKKASLKLGEVAFAPDRGLSFQVNVSGGEGCASKIVDPTWFARPKGAELASNAARLVQRAIDKMSDFPGVANWEKECKRKRVELEDERASHKIELDAANERLAEAERMIVRGAKEARAESAAEIAELVAARATIDRDYRAMIAEIAQLKAENGELDARVASAVKTRDDFADTVGGWAKQRRTDTEKILETVQGNLAALHAAQQSIEGVFTRQLGAFESLSKAVPSDSPTPASAASTPLDPPVAEAADSPSLDRPLFEIADVAQAASKDVVESLGGIPFNEIEFAKLMSESAEVGFDTLHPEASPFVAAVVGV